MLVESDSHCFAWALFPDRLHLLIRPNREQLAAVRRRLQTDHAVSQKAVRCSQSFPEHSQGLGNLGKFPRK